MGGPMPGRMLWKRRIKLNFDKNNTMIYPKEQRLIQTHNFYFKSKGNSATNIFEIWKQFSLDVLKNVSKITYQCRKDFDEFCARVQRNDLTALKMFDATAKVPSGLLKGNVNQYGDFDQCMEVADAQYCLVDIDIASVWTESSLSKYKDLVHSHFSIRETFGDPGHRIPGFSFIKWGFCLPRSCSSTDLTRALMEKLKVKARVRPGLCQPSVKQKEKLAFGDYFARVYFGIIFLAVGVSTCLINKTDDYQIGNKWFKMLMSFSLKYNYIQLTKQSDENKSEFKSVHGVRCLSAIALLMAHKTMALLYNPYINRTWMTETQAMRWSVLGRNAIIYTDCFLLISGLLNASTLFADLDKKEKIKFKEKLLNRLMRILPNLITVILFCTYILPYMGSGPLWPLVINYHSDLCKKYMWRNIFLIHNYYGFENMCLTHTHQIGIDFQLFLVTPIFVYLIWKFEIKGMNAVALIALSSTGLRFWKTFEHRLSHFIHFGIPISRLFNTANLSYILPTHRATVYIIGIFLAYLLRSHGDPQPFSKKQIVFGWIVAYTIGFMTWFGPMTMSVKGYEYNRFHAAIYGAVSPITWGAAVAWVIYATERGFPSWFIPLLTWKYFQIFTKIAYGVYLVQFPVFFYNVGSTRHVGEFKNYMMLPPVETGIIILIATVLTLFVEMPFQNIFKIFASGK